VPADFRTDWCPGSSSFPDPFRWPSLPDRPSREPAPSADGGCRIFATDIPGGIDGKANGRAHGCFTIRASDAGGPALADCWPLRPFSPGGKGPGIPAAPVAGGRPIVSRPRVRALRPRCRRAELAPPGARRGGLFDQIVVTRASGEPFSTGLTPEMLPIGVSVERTLAHSPG